MRFLRFNSRPAVRWLLIFLGFAGVTDFVRAQSAETAGEAPGLRVSFSPHGEESIRDTLALPQMSLFVPAGQAPTPFMSSGRFQTVWEGFIASDVRDYYQFQAELSGALALEINGAVVLEAEGTGITTGPTRRIRLNKGANAFKATFISPATGDTQLRLLWQPRNSFMQPVPRTAFSHPTGDKEIERASQLRRGRELFIEHRCVQCHRDAPAKIPELAMDAPAFDGIGSRRNRDWMARWILDPKTLRPTATMPAMLHGSMAKAETEAAAAFLASLKDDAVATKGPETADAEAGKKLFDALHCVACHNPPDSTDTSVDKISLRYVREKFSRGALPVFLQTPEEHFAWTRMPNFHLTAEEASQLAAYLEPAANPASEIKEGNDREQIERGRKVVQSAGCLNCHSLKLENQFAAPPLAALTPEKWNRGCLADKPDDRVPRFDFSHAERSALRAFGGTDRASLARHVPAEFADHQSRLLNCAGCHGKFEVVPRFEILGAKLKPEWAARLLAGEVDYKPRPWLAARMPSFAARAGLLAEGLAMAHGFPPKTPAEPAVDSEAADIGRKLVSSDGGFACVACHSVGSFGAGQVFESPGNNLVHAHERLLADYYRRWMRNPQLIDPQTKMPVYFDEQGKSPLTTILEGDGAKQIHAVWEYLRMGEKMPPPSQP